MTAGPSQGTTVDPTVTARSSGRLDLLGTRPDSWSLSTSPLPPLTQVTDDRQLAVDHAMRCGPVVIEEFLDGPEVSLFAITDGRTVRPLQPAQDFKRVGDGDTGPNTGGMGAYTPLLWAPDDLVEEVTGAVLQPTVDEMVRRGTPFSGLLYAGLALSSNGIRVVEFNVRSGDPETQPLLACLITPLGGLPTPRLLMILARILTWSGKVGPLSAWSWPRLVIQALRRLAE